MGLSHNFLNGSMPQELGILTQLGYLDLSYNNLLLDIPIGGHFNTRYSIQDFRGNPFLCGYPLTTCTQHNEQLTDVHLECKLRRQTANPKSSLRMCTQNASCGLGMQATVASN